MRGEPARYLPIEIEMDDGAVLLPEKRVALEVM